VRLSRLFNAAVVVADLHDRALDLLADERDLKLPGSSGTGAVRADRRTACETPLFFMLAPFPSLTNPGGSYVAVFLLKYAGFHSLRRGYCPSGQQSGRG
jgi:hypothetical protein